MNLKNQSLTLHSDAVDDDTLVVTKLVGAERLSGLFRFDLELLCQEDLDLEKVLYAPARLGIEVSIALSGGSTGSTKREVAGVLAELEVQEKGQGWVKYRAVLVPKAWQLTRSHRSRIFMSKALDELVTAVLESDELEPTVDFEFRLSRQGNGASSPARAVYPQHEYIVQYEETDWAFVARWLEHEGVWFYFVNDDSGEGGAEKLVFADTPSGYATSNYGSTFPYRPNSAGKDAESDRFGAEEIYSFRCRQTRLPKTVAVNDYNWRTPSAELKLSTNVLDHGTGQQTEYNDHFKTTDQGKALAEVRAEELACRAKWFHGESSCRTFRPGTTFTLEEHFRDELNDSFVLVAVRHEAEQMISLESFTVTGVKYRNTFEAIPASQAFRPERATPWPSIKGVMHAKVDAEGDGKYAELDELGRYKLVIPFDEHAAGAKPGKASRWVRMAQPYAGPSAGMHFPLLKGTEVLITHIDGDPDRPIIAAAVPNPETESPSTGANRTRNSIRTASGNVMQIDDDENASGFVFSDASSSRVSDYRWRTGRTTTAGSSSGSSPTAGGGGALPADIAQTPAGPLPTAGSGSATPPLQAAAAIISTVLDEGVAEGVGAAGAWRAFFRDGGANPTAFQQIADSGRYSDETASGLSLSAAKDENGTPLLTDTTLNQANIVTMFNRLLIKHPRASETATVADTELTGTIGKLTTVARNFEGLASGSVVAVEVFDSIKVCVGDRFEYVDGSNDIKIGTGGYSREETRGDGTKDTYRYGKSTQNEYTYGDKNSYSETKGKEFSESYFYGTKETIEIEFSGSSSQTIAIAAQSKTEVKLGGFNSNEVNLGVFNTNTVNLLVTNENKICVGVSIEVGIYAAGKFELEIAPWSTKFELTKGTDVGLSKTWVFLQDDDIALKKTMVALKQDDAALAKDIVAVSGTDTKISDMKAALKKDLTAISTSEACIRSAVVALKNDDIALMKTALAASRSSTAGLTMIQ